MNCKHILLYVFVCLLCMSCNGQSETPKVEVNVIEQSMYHVDSLLKHVKVLSSEYFEGRRTGTLGAERARAYIINKFQALNVKPLDADFEQNFTFERRRKTYEGSNVLGIVKGNESPEKYIVVSAHYDHEGIKNNKLYNGADDNASGISTLFAMAEYFQKEAPKHSIIFAAFDAEELGLEGSKYYVNHSVIPLQNIKLNINMDMISRSNKAELFAVGTRYSDQFEAIIKSYKSSEDIHLIIGHDGSDGSRNWTNSSDHAPFHKRGIPFIYFGVEDHKDYHRPTDDFENIHHKFYQNVVTTILTVLIQIDSMEL